MNSVEISTMLLVTYIAENDHFHFRSSNFIVDHFYEFDFIVEAQALREQVLYIFIFDATIHFENVFHLQFAGRNEHFLALGDFKFIPMFTSCNNIGIVENNHF